MKKAVETFTIYHLAIAVLLIMMASACGKDKKNDDPTNQTSAEDTSSKDDDSSDDGTLDFESYKQCKRYCKETFRKCNR